MTTLYRGFSLSNILGSQYLITYHGHLISLKLPVKLTKSNPFFGEICLSYCSRDLKVKCYQTYIRPIIEYAAVVWSPHTQSDINTVEMLQRIAARFVFNNFSRSSSVSNMLEHLGWDTLEQRRNQLTLLMFYKIIHQLVEVPHQHTHQSSCLY